MMRNLDEENSLFAMDGGCSVHGEEAMRECASCGAEYCRVCHPQSQVCPDCAEDVDEDKEDNDPDFEDVRKVDRLLDDDLTASPENETGDQEPP